MNRLAIRIAAALLCACAALAGAAAPASAAVERPDVSYDLGSPPADPNLNALDLYLPDAAAPGDSRPVVVYVHGGSWRAGDKSNQIADKVGLFTGAGYLFASLNYRLSPVDPTTLAPGRIMFPDHPHDVGEAIGWLARHAAEHGGDPSRILLIGHSAGAHLISLVSTDPSYVEAYGVEPWRLIGAVSLDTDAFDVADRIAELDAGGRATFFNAFGTPEENAASGAWAAGSPIRWADPLDPRFLIVAQAANANRLADNRAMAAALGQDPAGVFAAPYSHEGINDAVGGGELDPAGETAAIMAFFAEMVEASAAPRAKLRRRPGKRVEADGGRVKVRFKLASNDPDGGFECRMDSRKLKPCDAVERYRLAPGRHVFRFRALSARGRPGDRDAYRFRVEAIG